MLGIRHRSLWLLHRCYILSNIRIDLLLHSFCSVFKSSTISDANDDTNLLSISIKLVSRFRMPVKKFSLLLNNFDKCIQYLSCISCASKFNEIEKYYK